MHSYNCIKKSLSIINLQRNVTLIQMKCQCITTSSLKANGYNSLVKKLIPISIINY